MYAVAYKNEKHFGSVRKSVSSVSLFFFLIRTLYGSFNKEYKIEQK